MLENVGTAKITWDRSLVYAAYIRREQRSRASAPKIFWRKLAKFNQISNLVLRHHSLKSYISWWKLHFWNLEKATFCWSTGYQTPQIVALKRYKRHTLSWAKKLTFNLILIIFHSTTGLPTYLHIIYIDTYVMHTYVFSFKETKANLWWLVLSCMSSYDLDQRRKIHRILSSTFQTHQTTRILTKKALFKGDKKNAPRAAET